MNGAKHPAHKHEKLQQPTWLLVLEIATGVLLVVFVMTAIVTASKSCKLKPSIRISSWNRGSSIHLQGTASTQFSSEKFVFY
jgi:hypothetical protein